MPSIILSDTSASVSELKKNPMATVSAGEGILLPFLTGISQHSTVSLLSSMKECLMPWMTRSW